MKSLARSLIAAALIGAAGNASAVILNAGALTPLPGTSVAMQPQLAGLVLEDLVQAFSFAADGGTISGTVQSRVVRSTLDGTLDFYWHVVSDTFSSGAMQSFRIDRFFTSQYDADWRIDSLGNTAPINALLFANAFGQVNYEFGSQPGQGIAPGAQSYFLMMDTDATHYAKTARYDLANMGQTDISQFYDTFAPSAIPEPASAALLALGIAGIALSRRRKERA